MSRSTSAGALPDGDTARCMRMSATERVADRRADPAHNVVADPTDRTGQRRLGDRVKTVAVDDRGPVQANLDMVEVNLCGQPPDRSGDLGHRNETANVEHLGSCEEQDGSPLATNLGQPNLATVHGSPQASASVQKESARSGRLRYAWRSDRASVARTASATP